MKAGSWPLVALPGHFDRRYAGKADCQFRSACRGCRSGTLGGRSWSDGNWRFRSTLSLAQAGQAYAGTVVDDLGIVIPLSEDFEISPSRPATPLDGCPFILREHLCIRFSATRCVAERSQPVQATD